MKTVVQAIAAACGARQRCIAANSGEWADSWSDYIRDIERNVLPRGSGIDNGIDIDREASNDDKVVLTLGFQHMNDGGYYAGWSEHRVIVLPAFQGIKMGISGRNRNQIKDYLYELLEACLTSEYTEKPEVPKTLPSNQ